MPKQGSRQPWRLHQNYARDVMLLRMGPIEDEGLQLSRGSDPTARRTESALAAAA